MKAETESRTVDSEAINQVVEIAQRYLENNPAVILGSGVSVPHGLPSMEKLARKLVASPPDGELSPVNDKRWEEFMELLKRGDNLENVLQQCSLPENLFARVVKHVWNFVSDADLRVFGDLALNGSQLPLGRLFRHLFDSSNVTLSVVTTNYDRLAEYAADRAGYYHDTGLMPGYLRLPRAGPRPWFIQKKERSAIRIRTVNIWKVHGCLGWFRNESGEIIGMPPSKIMPIGCQPAIIMPGPEKYRRVLQEPIRSILANADDALTQAKAYLCVGFGFNDEHIQTKLESNWIQGRASLVILAKELSSAAKQTLSKASGNDFLALEKAEGGTRARWPLHPEGLVLPNCNLWSLAEFLARVTGTEEE